MTCCGQAVCTDCYVSLKANDDEVHCPYCDVAAFEVKYSGQPATAVEGGESDPTAAPAPAPDAAAAAAPPATQQTVVMNSVADRRELEAQIARQRDADLREAQYHRQTQGSGSRYRSSRDGSRGSGDGSGAAARRGPSTNLPDDLLSIGDYMRFYAEMRGLDDSADERQRDRRPPPCPECGVPTCISAHCEGGYANGLFICNLCQSTRRCSDNRWFCRPCSADICFRCRGSNRSDLPSDPSPVPSEYESGGNLRGSGASHPHPHSTSSSGGRSRHRLYASRSSQQSGLLASLQNAVTGGGSGSGGGDGSASSQWEQESDLLEEMMLLEAIQLSLQTSESSASADTWSAVETAAPVAAGVELPAVPEEEIAPAGAGVDTDAATAAPEEPAR